MWRVTNCILYTIVRLHCQMAFAISHVFAFITFPPLLEWYWSWLYPRTLLEWYWSRLYPPPLLEWYWSRSYPPSLLDWYWSWSYPRTLLEWYCSWLYPRTLLDWYCLWSYPPPLLDYYCCCNRIPGEALGVLIGPLEARKKYHKSEWPCYIVSSIRDSRWWWSSHQYCHFPTFCAFLFELTWQGVIFQLFALFCLSWLDKVRVR
jgi:hypothetical protein